MSTVPTIARQTTSSSVTSVTGFHGFTSATIGTVLKLWTGNKKLLGNNKHHEHGNPSVRNPHPAPAQSRAPNYSGYRGAPRSRLALTSGQRPS